jgi:hypothetical protein
LIFIRVYYQVYEGEWVDGQPKCGEFRDPIVNEENRFGKSNIRKEAFDLPPLQLKDYKDVLGNTIAEVRNDNMSRRGISDAFFPANVIEEAGKVFHTLDKECNGSISIYAADKVFLVLGLDLSRDVLRDILRLVDYQDQPLVSLGDILDITSCILARDASDEI